LPEPDSTRDELRARLWRLPRQLLLALINGTAILVIVAAILALVALSKVTDFANDVASTMTDAVLSRIDVKPRQVLANFQNVAAESMRWWDHSSRQGPKGLLVLTRGLQNLARGWALCRRASNNLVRLGHPS
jgi:hypothetical protein